jgi:hypothetical protein
MSYRFIVRSAALLFGLTTQPLGVSGQATSLPVRDSNAPVPRELVVALLGAGRGPGMDQQPPEIVVGRLPTGFPAELVPGNVEILGGLHFAGTSAMRSRRATVIAIIPSNDKAVVSSLQSAWERAGWTMPRRMQSQGGFVPGGFVPGGFVPESFSRPLLFCRDSSYLNAMVSPRPAGGKYLRLDVSTAQMSPCNATLIRDPEAQVDRAAFPALQAPNGVTHVNTSMGGSPFAREGSARLETDMTPAQLIAHYAGQLKAAGWTLRESVTTSSAVVQLAEKRNPRGQLVTGVLSAVALPFPRLRDVSFRMLSADASQF